MLIIEIRDNALLLLSAESKHSKFILNKTKTVEIAGTWKNHLTLPKTRNALLALLKEYSPGSTQTLVCLNLSALIYRDIEVPKADAKVMSQLVHNELVNALNLSHDYLIDYTVIREEVRNGNRFNKVLVTAIQASLLNDYLEFFKEAGLRIQAVDVGLNALFKYLHITGLLTKDNSVMVADVSPTHLRQYLFEKGGYSFYRSTRMNVEAEGGSVALIPVIVDNIDKMLKFAHAQGKKEQVDTLLLIGKNSIIKLRNQLNAQLDIQSALMPIPKILDCTHKTFESGFVYALGTFFSQRFKWKKDINLLISYNAYFKIQPFMINLNKHFKSIAAAILVSISLWAGFLGYRYFSLQSDIEALTAYLNQAQVVETLARVSAMRSHLLSIEQMNGEFDSIETVLDSIPRFNPIVVTQITSLKPEGIDITALRFKDDTAEFDLKTADASLIHAYVTALNQSQTFQSANYTQYEENDGLYTSTVSLTLKGAR